ncbi:MAG TPA: hypothetical protein V6D31_09535 [Candidatus Sericytochromatia bacterium]|jgi:hypothetical protein
MGRKAKLKKIRKETVEPPTSLDLTQADDPTKFVQQLGKQGYNLQQIQRSPELPNQKVDPQV